MGGWRITNPLSFFSDVWPNRYDKDGNPICRVCNKPVQPPKKFYCSDRCAQLAIDALNWGYARDIVFERARGICEFPGCDKPAEEIHHKIPVKYLAKFVWNELNRDPDFRKLSHEEKIRADARAYVFLHNHPSNLIALCHEHHVLIHRADRRYRKPWDSYEVGDGWRYFWKHSGQTSIMDFIRTMEVI